MVFLNWKELPWYWYGFDHFAFAALMVVLVPGRARLRVRLVRLPLAHQGRLFLDHHPGAHLRAAAVLPQRHGLRRQQRLHRLQAHPRLRRSQTPATRHGALHRLGGGAGLGFLAVPRHRRPRSSAACCWRSATPRAACASSAIPVEHAKLFVLTLSAVLSGIAGALYVPQVGIINPSEMSPANSIEIAIWVAVGGRGTLVGAIARRGAGQRRQELAHRLAARGLALRARRAVHPRDAVLPARASSGSSAQLAAPRADRRRRRSPSEEAACASMPDGHSRAARRCSISTTSPSASTASRR